MARERMAGAAMAVAIGLAAGCAEGRLLVTPAAVPVSESASTVFELEGLDPHAWLSLEGDRARPVADLAVRIGQIECEVLHVGGVVRIRPVRALPPGVHEAVLTARGRAHVAAPEIVVFENGAMPEAGPVDAQASPDAGSDAHVVTDSGPATDAAGADSGADVATDAEAEADAGADAAADAGAADCGVEGDSDRDGTCGG